MQGQLIPVLGCNGNNLPVTYDSLERIAGQSEDDLCGADSDTLTVTAADISAAQARRQRFPYARLDSYGPPETPVLMLRQAILHERPDGHGHRNAQAWEELLIGVP